jgi:DNA-binding CsgD family transcriptional regulator
MNTMHARWRWALEPAIGIAFGVFWLVREAPGISFAAGARGYAIVWIALISGLSLAISVSRVRWEATVALLFGVLVGQFVFPAARLVDSTWLVYLAFPIASFLVARYVSERWQRAVAFSLALCMFAVGALMCVPGVAVIDAVVPEQIGRAAGVFALLAGATVAAWIVGRHFRQAGPEATEIDDEIRASRLSHLLGRDRETVASLSNREREIFMLAARGLSNAEIARESFISEATVKSHIGHILSKLGLVSRVQIVAMAHENNLFRHPDESERAEA